jgi:hypothetical protein
MKTTKKSCHFRVIKKPSPINEFSVYSPQIFPAIFLMRLRGNFFIRILLNVKRFLLFILFTTAMLSLPAAAKRLTQGFRVSKMELAFPSHAEWDVPLSREVLSILDQPFIYIDKGSQSYVFESRDGNYVVKFFRFDNPEIDLKVLTVFNACKIAYSQLREETGLIYIHLNQTVGELPILHCKDAIGRKYRLPLDRYRFAIQKKAMPFRLTLESARHDPVLMQKRMDQFIDLLLSRTEKGVFNTDPTLSRNFGFLADRAIEVDFGNYRPISDHDRLTEVLRYTERLRRWLSTEAPEWVAYLDERTQGLK